MRLFPLRFDDRRIGPVIVLACWTTAVATGFVFALQHDSNAGPKLHAPEQLASVATPTAAWPSGVFRLLVFLHPQCPCSRATIEELDRIVARTGARAAVRVWVLADPDRPEAWTKSGSWWAACAIPGVEVIADVRGEVARAFGATTSGTTLCYAPDGKRLFAGGITGARGHAGDNAGRTRSSPRCSASRCSSATRRRSAALCSTMHDLRPKRRAMQRES
jgi:hypothetical protein